MKVWIIRNNIEMEWTESYTTSVANPQNDYY